MKELTVEADGVVDHGLIGWSDGETVKISGPCVSASPDLERVLNVLPYELRSKTGQYGHDEVSVILWLLGIELWNTTPHLFVHFSLFYEPVCCKLFEAGNFVADDFFLGEHTFLALEDIKDELERSNVVFYYDNDMGEIADGILNTCVEPAVEAFFATELVL